MTPSEKYVSELCRKSFLPFWSFPSPLGKKGKELCDVLVVCGDDIIIISIKDIKVSEHPDETIQYERWQKKAISDSIDQIYGAERFLKTVDEITIKDRETSIKLPAKEERSIFRIAIAFGRKESFPLETGNFGNGFVHVFDEESTFTVLNELDTFPDFINYLKAKEQFLSNRTILVPKEVDFLALYIQTSLDFGVNPDFVTIDSLWSEYEKSDEYKRWQQEIQKSYVWDKLIAQLYKIHIEENLGIANRTDLEIATRTISLESRINRIELGIILEDAMNKKVKARMIKLPKSNYSYVIMPLNSKNWDDKEGELQLRCVVARYENPTAHKVIGIAIGKSSQGEFMFDLAYFNIPELNEELTNKIKTIKEELGYFRSPVISHSKDMRG
jgi:hypothetical protein